MGTPLVAGRYALHAPLASGGMAHLHLGVVRGAVGFSRVIAIKRLHGHLAADKNLVAMFVDEARLASRIRHPNVIPILDVVAEQSELFVVMEYVDGEALSKLLMTTIKESRAIPLAIALDIGIGILDGLHAAHEARNERGDPLNIVHRDVSPQNVLVGADGITRVFDFGVAKAASRIYESNHGIVRGKVAYMSPEQIRHEEVDRRADVWSAAVVLWEVFARKRLFVAPSAPDYIDAILRHTIPPPSTVSDCPAAIDDIVMKGLERDPDRRWQTALEMAHALEAVGRRASARDVGSWVGETAREALADRRALVERIELDPVDEPGPSIRQQVAQLARGNVVVEVTQKLPPRAPSSPAIEERPLESTVVLANPRLSSPVLPPPADAPRDERARWVVAAVLGVVLACVLVTAGLALRPRASVETAPPDASPFAASSESPPVEPASIPPVVSVTSPALPEATTSIAPGASKPTPKGTSSAGRRPTKPSAPGDPLDLDVRR